MSLVLAPAAAEASRCRLSGLPREPITLGFGPAEFASTPSPCAHSRLALEARATALIDTPQFYGTLSAEALLVGSAPLSDRVWLTGAITAYRFQFVQNASVVATDTAWIVPASLGVHAAVLGSGPWQVSAYVRVLVDAVGRHATQLGAEPGVSALYLATQRVSFVGGLSVPMTWTSLGDRALTTVSARTSLDALFAPWLWLELGVGVEARVGTDRDGALEHVAPRAAIRVYPGLGPVIQLSAIAPVAGLERTDGRVALTVGSRW